MDVGEKVIVEDILPTHARMMMERRNCYECGQEKRNDWSKATY